MSTKHPYFEDGERTIGDFYNAVLNIHDGAEARAFYEQYVEHNMTHAMDERYRTPEGAAALARSNIGWVFGEGMPQEDVIMWAEACGAEHPIFGTMRPTTEQAFEARRAYGARLRCDSAS